MIKLRKGDIITIRATVDHDFDPAERDPILEGKVNVRPYGHHSAVWVGAEHAELLIPFFKNGDLVATIEGDAEGQVIATFDDQVWVRFDDGELQTWPAVALKHWRRDDVAAA